jgi:hypothetical protein
MKFQLVHGRLHYENPQVIGVGVRGYEEEPGPIRVVAENRPRKHFTVLKSHHYLSALYGLSLLECPVLIVIRVPLEVLDEKDRLELRHLDLDTSLAGTARYVKGRFVGEEIVCVSLDSTTIRIPYDNLDLWHILLPLNWLLRVSGSQISNLLIIAQWGQAVNCGVPDIVNWFF